MILIIAEFTVPLLAFVALDKFLNSDSNKREVFLNNAFYITGGVTLLFALAPSILLDFLSEKDISPIASGVNTPNGLSKGKIARIIAKGIKNFLPRLLILITYLWKSAFLDVPFIH